MLSHPSHKNKNVARMGHPVGAAESCQKASISSPKFMQKSEDKKQIPFDFAQGRLSTHHPQAEKRLGPRSLRMTVQFLYGLLGTERLVFHPFQFDQRRAWRSRLPGHVGDAGFGQDVEHGLLGLHPDGVRRAPRVSGASLL